MGNGAAAEGVGILNSVSHAGVSNVRKLLFINSSLYSGLKTNAENEQNAHKKKKQHPHNYPFQKTPQMDITIPPSFNQGYFVFYMEFIWN